MALVSTDIAVRISWTAIVIVDASNSITESKQQKHVFYSEYQGASAALIRPALVMCVVECFHAAATQPFLRCVAGPLPGQHVHERLRVTDRGTSSHRMQECILLFPTQSWLRRKSRKRTNKTYSSQNTLLASTLLASSNSSSKDAQRWTLVTTYRFIEGPANFEASVQARKTEGDVETTISLISFPHSLLKSAPKTALQQARAPSISGKKGAEKKEKRPQAFP